MAKEERAKLRKMPPPASEDEEPVEAQEPALEEPGTAEDDVGASSFEKEKYEKMTYHKSLARVEEVLGKAADAMSIMDQRLKASEERNARLEKQLERLLLSKEVPPEDDAEMESDVDHQPEDEGHVDRVVSPEAATKPTKASDGTDAGALTKARPRRAIGSSTEARIAKIAEKAVKTQLSKAVTPVPQAIPDRDEGGENTWQAWMRKAITADREACGGAREGDISGYRSGFGDQSARERSSRWFTKMLAEEGN